MTEKIRLLFMQSYDKDLSSNPNTYIKPGHDHVYPYPQCWGRQNGENGSSLDSQPSQKNKLQVQ